MRVARPSSPVHLQQGICFRLMHSAQKRDYTLSRINSQNVYFPLLVTTPTWGHRWHELRDLLENDFLLS